MSDKLWKVTAVAYIKAKTYADAIYKCDMKEDAFWDAIEVDDEHGPVEEAKS